MDDITVHNENNAKSLQRETFAETRFYFPDGFKRRSKKSPVA